MKTTLRPIVILLIIAVLPALGCGGSGSNEPSEGEMKILFLHHSTGRIIWEAGVKKWFKDYNKKKGTRYDINERDFPAESPYGWNNYPYDYWNIWVRNAADNAFKKEPTLEMLTKKYDMIIFKHCFPGSDIKADIGKPEIESDDKRIENYVLQYNALKQKMHEFPDVKFLVWTGAALVRGATDEERAARAKSFSEWVRSEWDEPGDNIFVWDFFNLETGGGLYLKDEYAKSPANSHPNEEFANTAAPLFCERIVNVLEGRGDQR